MKYMRRRVVTVRRQARAVYGYATAIVNDKAEIALMARSVKELEDLFHQLPTWGEFSKQKVRRVLWVDARKITTSKALKWPPLNGVAK